MAARSGSLETSEGQLVSVSISVEPRLLESLLEALAGVAFPINPQIYHDAYRKPDSPSGVELPSMTVVEFPAYAGRVGEVRSAIGAFRFDPAMIRVTGMLEEIQSPGSAG